MNSLLRRVESIVTRTTSTSTSSSLCRVTSADEALRMCFEAGLCPSVKLFDLSEVRAASVVAHECDSRERRAQFALSSTHNTQAVDAGVVLGACRCSVPMCLVHLAHV